MNHRKLKTTLEENELLEWCYSNLTTEQAADVEQQAWEVASAEITGPVAAEKLLEVLVKIIVRDAHEQGSAA